MKAGTSIEEPLAVGTAELVELVLEGPDDVELGGTHLGQPLHALVFVTQRTSRIEATPDLEVVTGAEMPARTPGAEWLVAGVGGDEAGRLERRAGIEVVGEWASIHTAVGVLVNQGHNRPLRLAHIMPSAMGRQPPYTVLPSNGTGACLHRVEGLGHLDRAT